MTIPHDFNPHVRRIWRKKVEAVGIPMSTAMTHGSNSVSWLYPPFEGDNHMVFNQFLTSPSVTISAHRGPNAWVNATVFYRLKARFYFRTGPVSYGCVLETLERHDTVARQSAIELVDIINSYGIELFRRHVPRRIGPNVLLQLNPKRIVRA